MNKSEQTGPTISVQDILKMVFRHKYLIVGVLLAGAIISVVVALKLSPVYRSSSTILIEQQEIPQDLVRSTVTSFASQRIEIISQQVTTTQNLWSVVQKYNLYPEERKSKPREQIVRKMRQDISRRIISAEVVDPRSGRPTQAVIAFSLSFDSSSPKTAQLVANEITSLYLRENLKNRTDMARETEEFLAKEVQEMNSTISQFEGRIEEFKNENFNSLPELTNMNLSVLQRQEANLSENLRKISLLEERKIYLESELAQIDPLGPMFNEDGVRVLSPAGRLTMLRSELAGFQAKYGQNHPDVIKTKNEISALEKTLGLSAERVALLEERQKHEYELIALKDKYSDEHPDVQAAQRKLANLENQIADEEDLPLKRDHGDEADNPAYIQLSTQLEATNVEIASLKESQSVIKAKIQEVEQLLLEAPAVERQYKELMRDYDNARFRYKEVKAKQLEAQLAQRLESDQKGERFTLIEPPVVPSSPIKPNKVLIVILGVVISVVMVGGIVFILEQIDDSIRGRKDVLKVVGAPPLAVIPYMKTEVELAQQKKVLKLAIISICAAAAVGIVLSIILLPMDMVVVSLSQKLGL